MPFFPCSIYLQNGSGGYFSPKGIFWPAHLGASWAVAPEAEVGESGCAIERWGDHQLPEQSTFGPKKSHGYMAALPQQLPVTCTRVAGLFLFCVASPVSLLSTPSCVCPPFHNTDAPACLVVREQNCQKHINLFSGLNLLLFWIKMGFLARVSTSYRIEPGFETAVIYLQL